ncbi:MAG: hypothetical protein LUH42_03705 [Oscillospiraceae bacterium]|nr:hypothetical protein [Oscillospiraceae bacterium]
MKKYIYEAAKTQREKPTEPNYLFCAPAQTAVVAANEAEAKALAEKSFRDEFHGTGVLLGEAKLVASYDLAVDWSYGYDDQRRSGPTGGIGDLVGNNVIR